MTPVKTQIPKKLNTPPSRFTPITRRMIILSLGLTEVAAIIGAAFGSLDMENTMLIVLTINTGFFSILKGGH